MNKQEALTGSASALHESYFHRASDDNSCAICGAASTPLAFHVLEKSYSQGETPAAGFVAMSEYSGQLSGAFPVCMGCSPPCRKCRLPISAECVVEFGIKVGAHYGNGVCEHMHLGIFFDVLRKRLFGLGRFKQH
jgi:hypothetical protein